MSSFHPLATRIALRTLFTLASLVVATTAPGLAQEPFWRHAGGPPGGTVRTFASAPDSSFYISTMTGLFHSSGTFTPDEALTSLIVSPLIVLPSGILIGGVGRTLARSTDGGRNWVASAYAGGVDLWRSLRWTPDQKIYVIKRGVTTYGDPLNELWRSDDLGISWRRVATAPVTPFAIAIEDDGAILSHGATGLHRSTDGGVSWTQLHTLSGSILVAKGDTLIITVGGFWNGYASRVFRSIDRGATWTDVGEFGEPGAAEYNGRGVLYHIVSQFTALRSTDWGLTWAVDSSLTRQVSTLYRDARGTLWAGTALEGIFRLDDDTGRWIETNRGFARTDAITLWVTSRGTIATDLGGRVATSHDTGRTWRWWRSPPGALSVEQTPRGTFILGTSGATVRSVDSGQSITSHGTKGFNSLLTLPNGRTIGGSYTEGVASSDDDGVTWRVDYRPDNPDSGSPFKPSLMATNGVVYVGTRGGYLLYSTDTGMTWHQTPKTLPRKFIVSGIAVSDSGTIYVSIAGALFRSSDTGATWARIDQGIGRSISDVVRTPNGHLFVTTDRRGVWRSVDDGKHWSKTRSGLPTETVTELISLDNGDVLVGTRGYGLWRCESSRRGAGLIITPELITFDTTIAGSQAFDTTVGVYNAGDDTLRDLEFLSTVGTSTVGDLDMLAPGDSATLHVTFTPLDTVTGTTGLIILSAALSSPDFIRFVGPVRRASGRVHEAVKRQQRHLRLHPNPVRDLLTIEYDLAISGRVRISLIDILGNERALIRDEAMQAGEISVWWNRSADARRVPRGVYICRIEEPTGWTSLPVMIE